MPCALARRSAVYAVNSAQSDFVSEAFSGRIRTASKMFEPASCSRRSAKENRAAERDLGTNPARYEVTLFDEAFSYQSCTITAGDPHRLRRPAYVLPA